MSKYEDARIVTFKEDYAVPTESGGTRVLYKNNSTHAIHKTIAAKLEKAGAKVSIEKLDPKKVIEKKKEALEKQKRVSL